tara:strand:+ start:723 stop:863 length:141 start_codon:yes stop_codon:yes gene_type:complete
MGQGVAKNTCCFNSMGSSLLMKFFEACAAKVIRHTSNNDSNETKPD